MSLKLSIFVALFASVTAAADLSSVQAQLQPVGRRQPAPGFSLDDSLGNPATLEEQRGKVVLLNFWATWCGGCKQEIPWFIDIQKTHPGTDLAVIGVSLDDDGWKVLKPFLSEHPIPYPILLGDQAIAKQYSIEGMPDTFLIDREGRIAATYRAGVVNRLNIQANIDALLAEPRQTASAQSRVLHREVLSKSLAANQIGVNPARSICVYLPPGYGSSSMRYPVIYYLPNGGDSPDLPFRTKGAQALFDSAIAAHVVDPFILVSADMNTPLGSSWSVNSPVTGNWEDFITQELVPYMDNNFRTISGRGSRGLLGDRMGGYGAIRFGMRYPEVFGSVYAMHPLGTGTGLQVMYSRPNWNVLWGSTSIEDVKRDPFSAIFASIFEAHLPNPSRPPLFVDLPAKKSGDVLVIDAALTERLQNSFLLDRAIGHYADNLKSLRGFKFDWARGDPIQDHVYGNQAFSHKLDEFGIAHEAEEYHGTWGERNWGEDGRVYTDVLPFFRSHLIFTSSANSRVP